MSVSNRAADVATAAPSQEGLFQPRPDGLAERVADSLDDHHPAVAALAVTITGWAVLSVVLVGIGLLLTDVLVSSSVADGWLGTWDADVNRWLAENRTSVMNTVTDWGSRLADTFTIIIGTAVLALVFLVRRWWQEALFIVLSPTIEVTVFLVTTFLVDRDRPPVERLDTAPPTSSFPSGHVAAAVAFYVALALIIDNRTRSAIIQGLAWLLAVLRPHGRPGVAAVPRHALPDRRAVRRAGRARLPRGGSAGGASRHRGRRAPEPIRGSTTAGALR